MEWYYQELGCASITVRFQYANAALCKYCSNTTSVLELLLASKRHRSAPHDKTNSSTKMKITKMNKRIIFKLEAIASRMAICKVCKEIFKSLFDSSSTKIEEPTGPAGPWTVAQLQARQWIFQVPFGFTLSALRSGLLALLLGARMLLVPPPKCHVATCFSGGNVIRSMA